MKRCVSCVFLVLVVPGWCVKTLNRKFFSRGSPGVAKMTSTIGTLLTPHNSYTFYFEKEGL
jgi:hypothetical protein